MKKLTLKRVQGDSGRKEQNACIGRIGCFCPNGIADPDFRQGDGGGLSSG